MNAKLALGALGLVIMGGCPQVLQSLVSVASSVPGATSCEGKPCQRDRWIVASANPDSIYLDVPGEGCDTSYALSFADKSDNTLSSISLNESHDLMLAAVTRDGVLHLAAFGDSEPLVEVDLDARYAAWSNSGDQLAVLVGRAPNSERALVLLNLELDETARFDLGMTNNWSLNWSADDSRIAVSGFSESPSTTCIIVTPEDASVRRVRGISCVFIGKDRIVGWNDAIGHYAAMTLGDASVRDVVVLRPQPISVRPGYAKEGVFQTWQEPLISLSPTFFSSEIRTEDAGPVFLTGGFGSQHVLIPIETARPVLEAAGFSVDGPCADQSGSGGG